MARHLPLYPVNAFSLLLFFFLCIDTREFVNQFFFSAQFSPRFDLCVITKWHKSIYSFQIVFLLFLYVHSEFLAEMYPQFDVGVRGVTWAQCLGVINNITKNLKKQAEKTSHLPIEVRFSIRPASSLLALILPAKCFSSFNSSRAKNTLIK